VQAALRRGHDRDACGRPEQDDNADSVLRPDESGSRNRSGRRRIVWIVTMIGQSGSTRTRDEDPIAVGITFVFDQLVL
jgi:hypothetical protein